MRTWKRLMTATTIAAVALLGAACADDEEGVEELEQTEVENTEVEGGTTTQTETEVQTETEPAGTTETSTEG